MKIQAIILAAVVGAISLMPAVAKADGEMVSFGDGGRVTERELSSGQNMVDTIVDASAEAPSIEEEFVSGGLAGPNQGGFVDPSTNS